MKNINRSSVLRIVAILLIVAMLMLLPISAAVTAEVEPRASYYLDSYNAYIYPAGWGKIQVWFSVTGVDYMDDIGVLNILLYESTDGGETWTWVETYSHDQVTSMLGHNEVYYSGHVEYAGTIGR